MERYSCQRGIQEDGCSQVKFWLKSKSPQLQLLLNTWKFHPVPDVFLSHFHFPVSLFFHQEPTRDPGRGDGLFCGFTYTESPLVCPHPALTAGHLAAMDSITK